METMKNDNKPKLTMEIFGKKQTPKQYAKEIINVEKIKIERGMYKYQTNVKERALYQIQEMINWVTFDMPFALPFYEEAKSEIQKLN